jgi:hypothetical protein
MMTRQKCGFAGCRLAEEIFEQEGKNLCLVAALLQSQPWTFVENNNQSIRKITTIFAGLHRIAGSVTTLR